MLNPAELSAAPTPAPAPAPSGLAMGVSNSWFSLVDIEDEDQDDDGWDHSFDYAAQPDALNPYAAQSFVYPSDDSADKEFAALVACVQNVNGMDAWLD